ncbi:MULTISPECIES: hypothetical protein [Bacillus]|uniref:hypothetical protein n=1 Tax=Bacillus TaxID=1386 RepID=UPI000BB6D592|nr:MULTISPECIES: hypothetical protein [Bacillus]
MFKKDLQNELNKISESSTKMMVDNILRKHNVSLDKSKITAAQKKELKKLVNDVQQAFSKIQRHYNDADKK